MVFPGSKDPVPTQARYTAAHFQVYSYVCPEGETQKEWRLIADFGDQETLIPPATNKSHLNTSVADISLLLTCPENYDPIMVDYIGFYCRLRGASAQMKSVPSPTVSKTVESIFYPLECQSICAADKNCVAASFAYLARTCDLHYTSNLQSEFRKKKVSTLKDPDFVFLPGSDVNTLLRIGEILSTGLKTPRSSSFMGAAMEAAQKTEQFNFLMNNGPGHDMFPGMVSLTSAMANSILSMKGPQISKTLSARDGVATIKTLQQGQAAIEIIQGKLNAYETNLNIADLKESVTEILSGDVNDKLDRGSFDFKFLVAEYNRINTRMNDTITKTKASMKLLQSSSQVLEDITKDAMILDAAVAAGKLVWSIFKLADPFNKGLTGDVCDVLDKAKAAWTTAGNIRITDEAISEMTDAIHKLMVAVQKSSGKIASLSKNAAFVVPFIRSFKDGNFEKQLTTEEENAFVTAYQNYKPPYDISEMKSANVLISAGMKRLCKYLLEKASPTSGPKVYSSCTHLEDSLDQMMYLQNLMNEFGNQVQLKAKGIVDKYLLVSNMESLSKEMQAMMERTELNKAMLLSLEVSALVSLKSLLSQYMVQISLICNLAEYYRGGVGVADCQSLYTTKDVLSVEQIFDLLSKVYQSVSTYVTSTPLHLCRKVPTNSNSSLSTHFGSFLDMDPLALGKSVYFQFPVNRDWLNMYGWDAIARGVDNGVNFLVEKIQVTIPYSKFLHSTSISLTFIAASKYRVSTPYGPKDYDAESANVKYQYVYSISESHCPAQDLERNLMEPCKSGDTALPKMCIESDGSIEKYPVFNELPTKPSLFSSFELSLENEDIIAPLLANRRVYPKSCNGTCPEGVLEDALDTVMCLDLLQTSQNLQNTLQLQNEPYEMEDISECFLCREGTYQVTTTQCEKCPTGTYQDRKGWFTCKQCTAGFYQDDAGQASCKKCPSQASCPYPGMVSPL